MSMAYSTSLTIIWLLLVLLFSMTSETEAQEPTVRQLTVRVLRDEIRVLKKAKAKLKPGEGPHRLVHRKIARREAKLDALVDHSVSWKEALDRGDLYTAASKIESAIDWTALDADYRTVLRNTLDIMMEGSRVSEAEKIVLVRGIENDRVYRSAQGEAYLLPNTIRYQRRGWDKRLNRINTYAAEAQRYINEDLGKEQYTDAARSGSARPSKVPTLLSSLHHHMGGGLGNAANSVLSTFISTSFRPEQDWGPRFLVLKVDPRRVVVNHMNMGEQEVMLPLLTIPGEVVAEYRKWEEVNSDPEVKKSRLCALDTGRAGQYLSWSNRRKRHLRAYDNVVGGRPLLEGIAPKKSGLSRPMSARVLGPEADAAVVERFVEAVHALGGRVERVSPNHADWVVGAQARTFVDPKWPAVTRVLLPARGPIYRYALIEELSHVRQIGRLRSSRGESAVARLFSAEVDPPIFAQWEVQARQKILERLPSGHAHRAPIEAEIKEFQLNVQGVISVLGQRLGQRRATRPPAAGPKGTAAQRARRARRRTSRGIR
ncbi:hypothetical protein JYT83_00925 [bacterium AH-315-F18]|nr:hypothetical protein [bacterium AH-315-F18]